MTSILVSDIFGRSQALMDLANALNIAQQNIIDPYSGCEHEFNDQQHAYAFFQQHVGLDNYTTLLKQQLKSHDQITHLIGFSIGASALWHASAHFDNEHIKQQTLFYGSQIRHMTSITPAVPTHIILPKYEPHFDVHALANTLSTRANVEVQNTPYLHGFMNPLSSHFHQGAYEHFIQQLIDERD